MEIDGQETIAAWNKIAPRIDRYVERIGDRSDFSVASGTSLSGDDAASLPYHVSHAVRMCFTAGIDHLHALRQLVVTDRVLHVAAPFSLARAALETFSAAFWILHPRARDERVTRALRWYMKNYIEQDAAATEIGQPFDLAAKRQKVFEVADQRGLPRDLIGTGYVSTTAVKYAQTHSAARVLFVWQLCSGFAHGRPWAYLGASEREECATADPSVQHVRMTSSYGTTLLPALNAVHLLEDVLRNYNLRSGGTFGAVR